MTNFALIVSCTVLSCRMRIRLPLSWRTGQTAQQRTADIMARQHRKERALKPRVAKYKVGREWKRYYAVGRIRLRGVHNFIDNFLTQKASCLSQQVQIKASAATDKANLGEPLEDKEDVKSAFPLPKFTSLNHAASDRKRGPMKNSYSAGLRLDTSVERAIKQLRSRPPVEPSQNTWAYTVLQLVRKRLGYTPTKAKVLCATDEGCVGTELDFIGKNGKGDLVIFELKSTSGGSDYWTKRTHAWSRAFLQFCQSRGLNLPQMLLSQCELDMIQTACGATLMKVHSRRWPDKLTHRPGAKVGDMLLIRSPRPDTAEAFRVSVWIAKLTGKIYGFMCDTA